MENLTTWSKKLDNEQKVPVISVPHLCIKKINRYLHKIYKQLQFKKQVKVSDT